MKKLIILLMLAAVVSASATLVYPNHISMDYGNLVVEDKLYYLGEFDLGKIAPGQELKLVFSRNTGIQDTESEASIFWHSAEGEGILSSLTSVSIQATKKVPESLRGETSFNITLLGSEIGTIVPHLMAFKMQVAENVFDYEFQKTHSVQAGKTIELPVLIKSNSAAEDTLIFSSAGGIPSGWIDAEEITMAPGESKMVLIKITPNEEGLYPAKISVGRKSSNLRDVLDMSIRVKPTFSSKLRAFSEGFSIIPVVMQPFYSLFAMIGLA